jgi:hypothetical protein
MLVEGTNMSDDVTDVNTTILIEIRDSIRETNARLDALDVRVNGRIDHMIDTMGAIWREHEQWLKDHDVKIGRLERHGRRSPNGPRRRK